ncbi:MAG TPA: hypothetical protein PLA43_14240 [Bryobacteraceae bacterium]|nr:hypothetical protein [Bryobacteraceae bacterium]HOQ46961.1 hypothetical protein [Bryobacteraceae bacterium]HPU73112.1 hypothetical protein [Bryobacteraceae bacterium]
MLRLGRRDEPEDDEKRVVYLEFIAAAAILAIVVLVLFMVFSFRPS